MLDWTRISELQDDLGEDGFAEMSELFLQEIATILDQLIPESAVTTWESQLHMIKGCALNMGLGALAGYAAQLEQNAHQTLAWDAEIVRLRDLFADSRQEFLSHFDPMAAA